MQQIFTLNVINLIKRGFIHIFKEILNLFVNFAQVTPVTIVINMFIMGKKLSYVIAVKNGLIKNVPDLQYINIRGSQQIVMKLGTVGLANLSFLQLKQLPTL